MLIKETRIQAYKCNFVRTPLGVITTLLNKLFLSPGVINLLGDLFKALFPLKYLQFNANMQVQFKKIAFRCA